MHHCFCCLSLINNKICSKDNYFIIISHTQYYNFCPRFKYIDYFVYIILNKEISILNYFIFYIQVLDILMNIIFNNN